MTIRPLRENPAAVPILAAWFKAEWPDFFAARGVEEIADTRFRPALTADSLPVVLVAEEGGELCGTVALRAESFGKRQDLAPWASGVYVPPAFRGRGLGRSLLETAVAEAGRLGFDWVYGATNRIRELLLELGWELVGTDDYAGGEAVELFRHRAG
jgi:GNAT superfamily N-acetyltransferase